MSNWFVKKFKDSSSSTQDEVEREKMARLEEAERELASLTERGANAVGMLLARNDRNHWRESIEDMIHGRSA